MGHLFEWFRLHMGWGAESVGQCGKAQVGNFDDRSNVIDLARYRRNRWRRRRRQSGAALIETAIALPLLLLLLFGIVTTARAWNVHNTLDHAAREAARNGAVTADTAAMTATANAVLTSAGIPTTGPVTVCAVTIEGSTVTGNGGVRCMDTTVDPLTQDRAQVLVSYPGYNLNFLFFNLTVNMSAPGVARLEP